ncbi:MAG: hypothetical protein NE328_05630 [Lentisphaeraceae bacterium]|nr:hypothetical protein [Lentisphaeraceae bacterium]
MRFILLLNFLLLSLYSFAQDPFEVPQEEIGKVGVYTVEQPGVPKHPDYEEIYRHNHGKKLSLDPTGKFYQLQFEKAKFKLIVPQNYTKQKPPGLLYLGFYDGLDTKIDNVIEYCKPLLKQRNLIAVLVDKKLRNPTLNDKNVLEYSYESAIVIRRSIDIAKERYNLDLNRIIAFSSALNTMNFQITALSCPDIFRYNILHTLFNPFYDNMPSMDNKKTFPSFGAQDQEITTLKKACKNNFIFFYIKYINLEHDLMGKQNSKYKIDLEDFLKKNNFINSKVLKIELTHDVTRYPEVFKLIDKIDPKPFNAKVFLTQAQAFEKKNNFPKAFEAYKIAANYGFEEAIKKFKEMNKELIETTSEINKHDKSKNYPEAFKLAQYLLKKFGTKSSLRATLINKTYLKDNKIILEIKAAAFLAKAEAALSQSPPPKDKIRAACEKVIKTVPDTFTAKKAQKLLKSLK